MADAAFSLANACLNLVFDVHLLAAFSGIITGFTVLLAISVYCLMGITPMIPKRRFLPITLFHPAAFFIVIPFLIYFHTRIQLLDWVVSIAQLICGLAILHQVQGGFKFRWPLVAENQLGSRSFGWWNLSGFLLVNGFVLAPAMMVYLLFCIVLGLDHFSDGFLKLRPEGLCVQVRKYVRPDGKTIQLFPMSHIGDSAFYQKVSQAFPTNSIVLLEGVTDHRHLLTSKISYQRMAASLGLAEQHEAFQPIRGELVMADVDVGQFAPGTIDLLNFILLIHAQGLNAGNFMKLLHYPAPPGLEDQLLEDLLRKRNQHLLAEIHSRLSQTDHLIVPWGAAHMPELANEIQKSGFRLAETRELVNIRFRSAGTSHF